MLNNIYTIANYDFSKPELLAMGIMCFESLLNNFDGQINVLAKSQIDYFFQPFIRHERLIFHVEPSKFDASQYLHKVNLKAGSANNIDYKLFHLCKIKTPFIFIDLDTYTFSPFKNLIDSTNKSLPLLCSVDVAQDGREKAHINSGLLLVNDPQILNWDDIFNFLKYENFKSNIPGSDQVVLHYYFHKIGYQYLENKISTTWNANSLFVELSFDDNNKWSANYHNGEKVNIIHYYGYKPHDTFCPIWYSYFKKVKYNLIKQKKIKKYLSYSLIKSDNNQIIPLISFLFLKLIRSKHYLNWINSQTIKDLTSQSNHCYDLKTSAFVDKKNLTYLEEDKINLSNISPIQTEDNYSAFHCLNDVLVCSGNLFLKKGKYNYKIGTDFEATLKKIHSCFLFNNTNLDFSTTSIQGKIVVVGRQLNQREKDLSELFKLNLISISNGYIRNLYYIEDKGFSDARIIRLQTLSDILKSKHQHTVHQKIIFLDFKNIFDEHEYEKISKVALLNNINMVESDNLSTNKLISNLINSDVVFIGESKVSSIAALSVKNTIVQLVKPNKIYFEIKQMAESLNLNFGFLSLSDENGIYKLDLDKLSRFLELI